MNKIYTCKLCDGKCQSLMSLSYHIMNIHKIKPEDYYLKYIASDISKPEFGKCKNCGKPAPFRNLEHGYKEFCSAGCKNKFYIKTGLISQKTEETCKICGFKITGENSKKFYTNFAWHLKSVHNNMTNQEYYDKYYAKPGEGYCECCGKRLKFYANHPKTPGTHYSKRCLECHYAEIVKKRKENSQKQKEFIKNINITKNENKITIENYIEELKKNAHSYDWTGERNTWLLKSNNNYQNSIENNILTDNSITYINGQSISNSNAYKVENTNDCDIITNNDFWI